ncbi:MAG: gliding motility-associated C-terminal domain-containing protein [Parabacteroides sp.]
MNYFRRAVWIGLLWLCLASLSAQYQVSGGKGTPLLAADNSANDVQVYLVNGTEGLTIRYTSSVGGTHQWYRYTQSKLDAVAIECQQEGNSSTVTGVTEGYGYFVEIPDGGLPKYVWITDYSRYAFRVDQLSVLANGDPCSGVQFEGKGSIPTIYYYLPNNGFRTALQREFDISYETLGEWSDELHAFPSETQTVTKKIVATDLEGTQFRFSLSEPPYVDTEFTLSGDQFARHFGLEQRFTTDSYTAVAVQLHVDTVLTMTEAPNMNTSREGYNAPATILFTATANEPVASRYVWRIYKIRDLAIEMEEPNEGADSETSTETKSLRSGEEEEGEEESTEGETEGTLLVNFSGNEVEYTFREQGVYQAVAEVSDQSGTCAATEALEITISTSYLDIPNVFSPGMTPGINDEFRVAYKSLVSFKAWIYNRWGKEMFHWTDPAQGWDGRKGGKLVPPGVYYYVIEAVGSDGRRYKRAGDVNILRSKQEQTETIEETTE